MFETLISIAVGAALMGIGIHIGHAQERDSQKHTDRLMSNRSPR